MAKRPRQQRILSYGEFRPTGVDDSAARRMQALAGLGETVAGVAEQFGRAKATELAPEQAKIQIDEATNIDPETGEVTREKVEMRSGFAWGADAYNQEINTHNKAIDAAYLSDIDRDNAAKINELRDNNINDPEQFITLATAYSKGVIGTIKPEFQGIVSDSLRQNIFTTSEQLKTSRRQNDIANSIQKQVDNASQKLDDLSIRARKGEDVSAQRDELVLAIQTLSELSPEQKRQESQRISTLDKSIYESKVSGELNRIAETDGPAEASKRLQEIKQTPQAGYSDKEWDAFINNEQTQLGRTKTLIDSTNQLATVEKQTEITEYVKKAELGFSIPEAEQAKMTEQVAGTKYEASVAMATELAQFAVQPVSVRKELIAQSQKSGNATLTANLITLNNRLQSEIANDAFGLGMKQGYVEYTTLNVSDILSGTLEEAEKVFKTRKADASLLSTIYGTNVSVLTKEEASQLTAALPNMNEDQKMRISRVLGANSGVWAQIATDPTSGAFAQVSALGNDSVSRTVFRGQEALATENVKPVSGKDLDQANDILDEVVGNVYGNFDKESVREAALSYYYGSNPRRDSLEQDKWRASIQAVTGGIEKVRGVPTQLTGVGVDKVSGRDLDLYFKSLTTDDLEKMNIKPILSEVTIAYTSSVRDFSQVFQQNQTLDKIYNGRIEAVAGQGNYVIVQGNQIVTDADGADIIFNVTKQKVDAMKGTEKGKQQQKSLATNEFYETGVSPYRLGVY